MFIILHHYCSRFASFLEKREFFFKYFHENTWNNVIFVKVY